MTGCKGYGLRGSDARTEIERTKEADTPGEIPGRSGLQADRRTGNKFIMRGVWLRSKEKEEIIMTLSMKEKKILYAYGCPSHHNTVTRLKWLTALTVDPDVFVIGGGVSKAGQVLIDVITKYYHNFAKIIGDNKAKVVLAKLGNDAGIYGAARMVLK